MQREPGKEAAKTVESPLGPWQISNNLKKTRAAGEARISTADYLKSLISNRRKDETLIGTNMFYPLMNNKASNRNFP